MRQTKTSKFIMWIIAVYLLLPLFLTFIYSMYTEWNDIFPRGFTLKYYVQLFSDGQFWIALLRTVMIAFVPVVLVVGMLLLVMYVTTVYHPEWDRYVNILCTMPYAIQGIILPISIISLYSGAPGILSNRIFLLILTYCIVILPYMYQGIKNSLSTIDVKRVLEAAQLLGASKFYAFFKIVVPSILTSILIASLLSIAIVFGDFAIVNIIAGSYYTTAQVYLYRNLSTSGQFVSSIIVVLFLVTLAISIFAFKKKKEN